jgi:hypothetical protein
MTSIRKFLYAGLVALSSLNFSPRLASAQDTVSGKFTLAHQVRWQNAVVPAGDYRFSFDPGSTTRLLVLTKMSGARTGFLILVRDTADSKPSDVNELLVEYTTGGRYVTTMKLPHFGLTLNFPTSSKTSAKQMAQSENSPMIPGQ